MSVLKRIFQLNGGHCNFCKYLAVTYFQSVNNAKIDLEITLKTFAFIHNSIGKVKPSFLLSAMCMFPEPNGTKFWSHSFHLQNSGTLQTRMDQRGTPWKWNLRIFKYKNEYHKQLAKKQMKKWGHMTSFLFSFLSYGHKCFFHRLIDSTESTWKDRMCYWYSIFLEPIFCTWVGLISVGKENILSHQISRKVGAIKSKKQISHITITFMK